MQDNAITLTAITTSSEFTYTMQLALQSEDRGIHALALKFVFKTGTVRLECCLLSDRLEEARNVLKVLADFILLKVSGIKPSRSIYSHTHIRAHTGQRRSPGRDYQEFLLCAYDAARSGVGRCRYPRACGHHPAHEWSSPSGVLSLEWQTRGRSQYTGRIR
jgi:hypothetical protein